MRPCNELRPHLGRRRFLKGTAAVVGLGWLGGQGGCALRDAALEFPGWKRDARLALARSQAWLWAAQAPDGRFASEVYGLLSSGQSLTPFVLNSLLRGPQELLSSRSAPISRAVEAMLSLRDESGALGFAGPVPDYPCYATGLLLSCLEMARPSDWLSRAQPSIAWLRAQQFRSEGGWLGHPAQGGWGMGSRRRRTPPHAGHVDLSMTRRAVQGLRAGGVPEDDPGLAEARDFVSRCQTPDGSFVYSPVELALNKGLRDDRGRPRGYGSATTDGLLALWALGRQFSEPSQRGEEWLRLNHRVDRNPGLDGGPMEAFAEAMRGYYRAGAARCFAQRGGPQGWREQLVSTLLAEEQADGSSLGVNGLQKEDDPLIATAFAAQALAAALSGDSLARAAALAWLGCRESRNSEGGASSILPLGNRQPAGRFLRDESAGDPNCVTGLRSTP